MVEYGIVVRDGLKIISPKIIHEIPLLHKLLQPIILDIIVNVPEQ